METSASKPTAVIRSFARTEWRRYREIRLGALEDSPDAFASRFADQKDLEDTFWSARVATRVDSSTDLPLLAEVGREPAGMAWGRIEPEDSAIAELLQMWVAPHFRGLGIGNMIVDAVITWATAAGAVRLVLGATCGNTSAMRLYLRAGFEPVGEPEELRLGSDLLAQPMELELLKGE